jgi:hypothetical protein
MILFEDFPMLTEDEISFLKNATYKDLLTLWRFEPNGSKWFASKPHNDAFNKAFDKARNRLTIQQMSAISKEIGFRELPSRGSYDQRTTR